METLYKGKKKNAKTHTLPVAQEVKDMSSEL
jgi:hypothetical protein